MIFQVVFIIFCLFSLGFNPAAAKTITLAPATADILFHIQHDQGYTVGYFHQFSGTLEMSDGSSDITAAKAQVQTASIYTRSIVRDEGLKSALFLDTAKFPEASFESTKIEGDQLSGILTIKGISKLMSFKIERPQGKIVLKGSFNRQDYGITYNKLVNKSKSIGDVVELIVELKV